MGTTKVVTQETDIPSECFGTEEPWKGYWESLDLVATQLLNQGYYKKFELARKGGYLFYARVGLLSGIDFASRNLKFDPRVARKIYELLCFSGVETERLRQSGYQVEGRVPVGIE
ncbi:MAG TPA: hypothetical protein ENI66_01615 [Candidatus Yonathbacteria bacterium]|nr:hypothetical protein [Candidatus Yonathbacteria bacterium]